jgi:hypothetical protein
VDTRHLLAALNSCGIFVVFWTDGKDPPALCFEKVYAAFDSPEKAGHGPDLGDCDALAEAS